MIQTTQIIIDDREVLAVFSRLISSAGDMTPIMADIAQALESETERQFEAESGPLGPWPTLAPSTILERMRAGKWPGKILQRSAGGLAASIFSGHGRDFAEVGSNKPYAAIQHFGGKAGRGRKANIPARPYFPFNPVCMTLSEGANGAILDVISDYLSQSFRP